MGFKIKWFQDKVDHLPYTGGNAVQVVQIFLLVCMTLQYS